MKKTCWMLLFFIAALYLLPIIFRPLLTPEEFRCAEIPREMLAQGEFISPKLLGVRFFEKTPLGYWLTAGSFKVFGQNAFALRLISVLGAVGSALFLGLWCRRRNYSTETSFNAVFLYLSCLGVWILGNLATIDALFCMWLTGTFVCLALAFESQSRKERLLLLAGAGVAAGCGFLTGGFPAFVLPAVSAAAFLLWQRRWKALFLFPWIPLIAAVAVIAPWGLAVHKAEPDFWRCFVVYEQIQRFLKGGTGQTPVPIWLLLPCFIVGLFPGVFPVLSCISRLRKNGGSDFFKSPEVRYSCCALLFSLIFLLLSKGKVSGSILPCFAPAAMLGAMLLDKRDPERSYTSLRQLTTIFSIIFIVIGSAALLAGLFYLLWGTGFIPVLPLKIAVWAPFFTTAALGLVISGTIFFVYRREKLSEPYSYFMLYAVTSLICLWFMPVFTASSRMPEYELLEIANKISSEKLPRPRIIAVPQLGSAAAWCFKDGRVQLLNSAGELEYGHRNAVADGAQPLTLNLTETAQLLKAPARKEGVLIILRKCDIEEMTRHLPAGTQFTTAGDICAFYYPGNTENKEKQ